MREFTVRTRRKTELVDITARVQDAVRDTGRTEGICCVYVPHATAAILINENADPQICDDLLDALAKLFPDGVWRHDRIDRNASAHLKSALAGPGQVVPVAGGRLLLGRWQAIMLAEFDGPRDRRVIVTVS
jgi:secondary thiamine-phosphate synthase enzyme